MPDTQAARELELYIDNNDTYDCYRKKIAIQDNLLKKKKKGIYDSKKAAVGFKHVADSCAKKYAKDFDSPSNWNRIFSVKTRKLVARELAKDFESNYRSGEFGGGFAGGRTVRWVGGGVVAAAAIGGAIFFFTRKKKKKEEEKAA